MTNRAERKFFEKELLAALRRRVRGNEWKPRQNTLFRVKEGFFVAARIHVFHNRHETSAVLEAKPMRLDSLYWRITALEENEQQPLSFRAWGAYTCAGLPVSDVTFRDEEYDARTLAAAILGWADEHAARAVARLSGQSFAAAVARHPNQVERGAYAITLVTSLIEEGNWPKAAKLAREYVDGSRSSAHVHRHCGRDFHELALEWIEKRSGAADG